MPEKVLKSADVRRGKDRFTIVPPSFASVDDIEKLEATEEEYKGPSVEEIEAEINHKKSRSEEDLRGMKKRADEEAKRIVELAEAGAFQRIKTANEEYKKIIESARREGDDILHLSRSEAEKIVKAAEDRRKSMDQQAYDEGYNQGMEKAYTDGKEEISRMIGRLEKILGETINKRNEIIESSERQLTNIAIVIARKVVKAITESDQAVILRNVSEALRKIKGRAQVTIRVNIADLELTARHKDDFYRMLDNIENVNVLEDPNIEKGGCIIETDFGDIDARISAQLDEIETAIRNIQPIKDL